MSWIDSENVERCVTDASMDNLEKVLKLYGYNVQRTKYQIVATHGGTFSTNGHLSTITVVNDGTKRICEDRETAKGEFCRPETGLLIEIIKYAESPEELDTDTNIVHPTSSKQGVVWGFTIGLCVLMILGLIYILNLLSMI